MFTFIVGFVLFVCFLLVLVILAQNAKGGGLTSQFGGSGATNIIGVKKTGDLLEKLTWGFAVTIMVLVLSTNVVDQSTGRQSNDILEKAGEQAAPAPTGDDNLNLGTEEAATDSAQ
jgi:preprotein translocase subunit SecG